MAWNRGERAIGRSVAKSGFTLIELLVVLVIISVIAGFVAPRLIGSLTNLDLKTASKRVAASLRYARSQAAARSTTYFAFFDMDRRRVTVGPKQTAEKNVEETEVQENEGMERPESLKHYDLPENVIVKKVVLGDEEASSGFFSIGFFPDGGSSGGTVILSNTRGHAYRIITDFITGTVQVGAMSSER